MLRFLINSVAVSAFLLSGAVSAQAAEVKKNWKNSAEVSYLQASGNSDSATLGVKELFSYSGSAATAELKAYRLESRSGGAVSAEQYEISEKLGKKLGGGWYIYQKGTAEKDRFAGFLGRFTMVAGAGREIKAGSFADLTAEAGFGGYGEDRIKEKNLRAYSYRIYSLLNAALGKGASASQEAEFNGDPGRASEYRFNMTTSFSSAVTDSFTMKFSYQLKYVNSPSAGYGRTNSVVSMAAVFVH